MIDRGASTSQAEMMATQEPTVDTKMVTATTTTLEAISEIVLASINAQLIIEEAEMIGKTSVPTLADSKSATEAVAAVLHQAWPSTIAMAAVLDKTITDLLRHQEAMATEWMSHTATTRVASAE